MAEEQENSKATPKEAEKVADNTQAPQVQQGEGSKSNQTIWIIVIVVVVLILGLGFCCCGSLFLTA